MPDLPANPTDAIDSRPRAEIGVLGGSGFYSFLSDTEQVTVQTPFGEPSAPLILGDIHGRRVAFLARHGRGHRYPAHRVNYRANLWALRSVGVRQVLAAGAVGSLLPEQPAGTVVVPDQLLDRTWGRAHTVYDEPGATVHVGFADPFCPRGREAVPVAAAALASPLRVVDGGTLVVINGPRFSTRAEAAWHRQAGASIVGMTSLPEAAIARELALCYTTLALVTDLDAGVGPDDSVTHAEVFATFEANMPSFKELVRATVTALPPWQSDDDADCPCRRSVDGLVLPFDLP